MDIRSKALYAAASVVLALGPGGCFKPTPTDTSLGSTDDSSGADTSVTTDDTSGATDDTSVATDDTSAATDDTAASGEPDCTAATVEDLATCCDERRAWCGAQYAEGTEAYNECVFGPGFDGSTGCSPWGPPVPPKFERRLA